MADGEKLLIIGRNQFGYLTDSYKWCEHLRDRYDITYICFDYGRPRIEVEGIRVIYVTRKVPMKLRGMLLLASAAFNMARLRCKTLVTYFPHCSIIKKMMPWRRIGIDVRTLDVSLDAATRQANDDLLRREVAAFDVVSAISPGVAAGLRCQSKPVHILPLGSDVISTARREYASSIRIIYVGTFTNRNIHQTVEGLGLFHAEHPDTPVSYDIIGFGSPEEERLIAEAVKRHDLEEIVNLTGRIPHNRLKPYFDKANVGVSYVPITDYYQHQPPTKTFEYGASGIFIIGTATSSNAEVINSSNGIAIDDTPRAMADALQHYWEKRLYLSESAIRESMIPYTWDNICRSKLVPLIDAL